jgi:hypothetical protein
MIYIFDNGRDYSDHDITFVTTDGYDQGDAEKILRHSYSFEPSHDDEGFLVAKAADVEWWRGDLETLSWVLQWRECFDEAWVGDSGLFDLNQVRVETVRKPYEGWKGQIAERRARLSSDTVPAVREKIDASEREMVAAMEAHLAKRSER